MVIHYCLWNRTTCSSKHCKTALTLQLVYTSLSKTSYGILQILNFDWLTGNGSEGLGREGGGVERELAMKTGERRCAVSREAFPSPNLPNTQWSRPLHACRGENHECETYIALFFVPSSRKKGIDCFTGSSVQFVSKFLLFLLKLLLLLLLLLLYVLFGASSQLNETM